MATSHTLTAIAYVDNFPLKELATGFPGARRTAQEVAVDLGTDGAMLLFAFGAVVFCDTSAARQEAELESLRAARPTLFRQAVVRETFEIHESPGAGPRVEGGILQVDALTPARRSVVAQIVAQSAAMEYYEGIVERLLNRTSELVAPLEQKGTVTMGTRSLHRFIGKAIETRTEVLSVLHLLDKPDAIWDDPAIDRIYGDLRAEFDLVDRFTALEHQLRSVQESLELIVDVARDRRLVLLEVAIVALIVIEIVMSLVRG